MRCQGFKVTEKQYRRENYLISWIAIIEEGPLYFFVCIFSLSEPWMRIYFLRDSWLYIFPYLGNWFSIFLWSVKYAFCKLICECETTTFAGNNFSLFWRFQPQLPFTACMSGDTAYSGTTAEAQGPQETVSSVVMEEERRILKALHNNNDLLDHFNLVLEVFKRLLFRTLCRNAKE